MYYYLLRCSLAKNGESVGEGIGSCNSWESKYRYRNSSRVCPTCGAEAIIKGKAEYGGGWVCYARRGGCGAKFADNDPAMEQEVGKVPNPDISDLINTCMKQAEKRAYVEATLSATGASAFFSQDEDVVKPPPVQQQRPADTNPPQQQRPANVSPLTGRIIPEQLLASVEAIQRDGRITQSLDILKKAMEHRGGANGIVEYERVVNEFACSIEKSKRTRAHYVEVLLDLFTAFDALQPEAPTTTEFVGEASDVPF